MAVFRVALLGIPWIAASCRNAPFPLQKMTTLTSQTRKRKQWCQLMFPNWSAKNCPSSHRQMKSQRLTLHIGTKATRGPSCISNSTMTWSRCFMRETTSVSATNVSQSGIYPSTKSNRCTNSSKSVTWRTLPLTLQNSRPCGNTCGPEWLKPSLLRS